MNIKDFRIQYPQYNSLDDIELSKQLHQKYYPDITFQQFATAFGVDNATKEVGAVDSFVDEYSKGVYRGFLNTASGLVGTAEFLIPGTQESLLGVKQNIQQAAERFRPTHEGAAAWSGKVLGEAIPFMATAMAGAYAGGALAGTLGKGVKLGQALGAGGVAFAVEGDAAYDAAKNSGASEFQAQTERILVGSINAYLESLQISKLIDFHSAGKHSIKGLVKNIRKKAWGLVGGDVRHFTGEVLKLAVSEGLQEMAQEGVSVGIPAAIRGEYPRLPDGSPDYYSVLTQIGEAGLGGAFAGTVLGGGGAFISSTPSIAAPTLEEARATAQAIDNSKLNDVEKIILKRRLDETTVFAREGGGVSETETLIGSAIRLKSGEMLTGTTHADILREVEASGRTISNEEFDITAGSGFVTNTGRFVSPEEAWKVADKVGQIKKDEIAKELVDKKYLIAEGVNFEKGEQLSFAPIELTKLEKFRNKMDDVVIDIEQLRPTEEAEISAERGKRFGEFRNIVNSIDDPRQAMIAGLAAMKGQLKQEITPLTNKFESSEIYTARKELINSTVISEGELMSGYEGLEKLLVDGIIPAPHELQVLQKANLLSKEAIKEILKNRTKYQKTIAFLKDLSFAPWSLLTSIDLSAGGRQGWKILFHDPKLWLKSVGRGYKMLMSEDYFNYTEIKRKTHPYYAEAIKRGVEETGLDTMTRGEEMFASNMIQKIPGIRGSARGFVGLINELRMGWYFKGREMAEGVGATAKQQRDLADIANDLTGRGKLPKALKKLQEFGLIFFAPRLTMALVRTPIDLLTKTGIGRKMLAHTLASFVGFTLATLYLLDQDDKDKIDVEWSPLSSDFLKVRHRKTRIDITGGYQPLIRSLFQTIYGKRKATETGRIYDVERTEIISRFLQSKLSPHAGLAVDLWRGETFLGEKLEPTATGIGKQIYERATPLFIQDTAEAFKHEGFGVPSVLASALAFHGIGVQTYPPTLTQNVRTLKDNLASKYFGGVGWDDLGPNAQEAIMERHPQIELMEDEAGIDRQDFDFIGKILEQADAAGRKVQKNLNETIRKELEKYVLDVGNLTRNIGSGWYLDDARYKVYQAEITKSLNLYLNKLLNHSAYKQARPELRREILKEVIDEVKKEVRLKLITQANFNDLRRREQMK